MRKSLREHQEDRIVASADTDFGVILAAQEADHPSFVLVREPNLLVAHYLCEHADSGFGNACAGIVCPHYNQIRPGTDAECPRLYRDKKAPRR
jgi:hypothetical protein